ncbi:MAG: reverse transcriptase family protein [Sphingomonadales bacterium]
MNTWDPQHFRKEGLSRAVPPDILDAAEAIASNIKGANNHLPPIFTLRHLTHLASVDFGFIRNVVDRTEHDPYEIFRIRKKGTTAFRVICIPDPKLLAAQRWIAQNILRYAPSHSSSYAFAPKKKIRVAAALHCGCKWLIKMDVRRFFESVSEIAAYRVFNDLGYEPLVSFELARICTRLGPETRSKWKLQWRARYREHEIERYRNSRIGHLPQGAPTSPMLSNLAMIEFDRAISEIARKNSLIYTRYADDICLSKHDKNFSRKRASKIIGQVSAEMGKHGLSPNIAKTKVSPPGARKVVLGLLVDGDEPKLSREFRARLRQHLHYLTHLGFGPAAHAKNRGFTSVEGMRNHIEGLIAYAHDIDNDFAANCRAKLNEVSWPFENS